MLPCQSPKIRRGQNDGMREFSLASSNNIRYDNKSAQLLPGSCFAKMLIQILSGEKFSAHLLSKATRACRRGWLQGQLLYAQSCRSGNHQEDHLEEHQAPQLTKKRNKQVRVLVKKVTIHDTPSFVRNNRCQQQKATKIYSFYATSGFNFHRKDYVMNIVYIHFINKRNSPKRNEFLDGKRYTAITAFKIIAVEQYFSYKRKADKAFHSRWISTCPFGDANGKIITWTYAV